MMRVFKSLCVAVFLATALQTHGDSWDEWLDPGDDSRITAEFRPGWVVESEELSGRCSAHDLLQPNRGYTGDILFNRAPGADAVRGPFSIRLLYSVAASAEMNWPDNDELLPLDFVPMPLPDVAPRRTAAETVHVITDGLPATVPVLLPASCGDVDSYRSRHSSALFCRYEALDAAGRVMCRGILSAFRLREDARLLVGMDDADEAMKEVTRQSGAIERVGDLPDEMSAYRQVNGIWFTDSLWIRMEGREDLLRRLLLAGIPISGETGLVSRIQSALGTGWQGRALAGSVVAGANWRSGCPMSFRDLNLKNFPSSGKCQKDDDVESVFENEGRLFKSRRNSFLVWSLTGLFVFCAGVAAALILILVRRKGERRVIIWWALPAWTLLCFVLIWALGLIVLDRRNRADVTEYRLVMAGWPEMHCRAVASAMTFQPGRPEWKLPAGAVLYDPVDRGLDGWWNRLDSEFSGDCATLRLPQRMTGNRLELEAGWFEPASAPVTLKPADDDQSDERLISATDDLDGVYVLAHGKWRALGAMKKDAVLDPFAADALEDNRLQGLPSIISDAFSDWHWRQSCENDVGDLVVVAWKRDVPSRMAPAWKNALVSGRVIWVIQCP